MQSRNELFVLTPRTAPDSHGVGKGRLMGTHVAAMLLMVMLLSGCMHFDPLRGAIGSYRNYTAVNGKIENGIFYDPHGRFTMEVPPLVEPGAITRGRLEKEGGTVVFSDDFGKLIRIDVATATDPASRAMLHNSDWQAVFSQNRAFMGGLYQTASPKAEIIHQELLTKDNRNLDFYVFTMPGGSTLADAATGKRHDALRASLSLLEGDSLFTITTQHIIGMWRQDEDQTEVIAGMKTTLLDTLVIISFQEQEGPTEPKMATE